MNPIVVVDHAALTYFRYEGKTRTHKFGAAAPLSEYWVEVIRVKPSEFEEARGEGPEVA